MAGVFASPLPLPSGLLLLGSWHAASGFLRLTVFQMNFPSLWSLATWQELSAGIRDRHGIKELAGGAKSGGTFKDLVLHQEAGPPTIIACVMLCGHILGGIFSRGSLSMRAVTATKPTRDRDISIGSQILPPPSIPL